MVSSLICALLAIAMGSQTECQVLYFQSAQCEPCRQFEPTLVQLQQQGWDVRKIDAPAQLDLAKQFQIRNLPTVIVLSGQREVDRIVGVVSLDALQSRLNRVAARGRSSAPASSIASSSPAPSTKQPANLILADSGETKPIATAQPIVRGQSPNSIAPGQAFPMLASNSSGNRQNGESNATDLGALQLNTQPSVQLASASQNSNAQRSASQNGLQLQHQNQLQQQRQQPSLAAIPVSSQLTLEQAIARATDATVRIKVEESNTLAHGTGTIVAVHGDEALVLTCGHLFRDMLPGSQLSVDLFAGTPRQVNLVAQLLDFKADKEDIALLSVRLPVKLEPVPILPKGQSLKPGQAVFSIGCDHGNNPTRHDTKISNVNRYLGAANVEIVGAPAVGRSGGGLFDGQGRLLGVCNAASKEDNEGIYAGPEVVYQQIARIGHSHLFDGSTGSSPGSADGSVVLASGSAPVNLSPQANQLATNQLSSNQISLNQPPGAPADSARSGLGWPDEDPRLSSVNQVVNQTQNPSANNLSQQSGNPQLTCVIRDANGQERVVTIAQPSSALLQAIEQQGGATR
jgi:thiol-disulfide isomerase/thioredoxin